MRQSSIPNRRSAALSRWCGAVDTHRPYTRRRAGTTRVCLLAIRHEACHPASPTGRRLHQPARQGGSGHEPNPPTYLFYDAVALLNPATRYSSAQVAGLRVFCGQAISLSQIWSNRDRPKAMDRAKSLVKATTRRACPREPGLPLNLPLTLILLPQEADRGQGEAASAFEG
jgi:hypothetical protein